MILSKKCDNNISTIFWKTHDNCKTIYRQTIFSWLVKIFLHFFLQNSHFFRTRRELHLRLCQCWKRLWQAVGPGEPLITATLSQFGFLHKRYFLIETLCKIHGLTGKRSKHELRWWCCGNYLTNVFNLQVHWHHCFPLGRIPQGAFSNSKGKRSCLYL